MPLWKAHLERLLKGVFMCCSSVQDRSRSQIQPTGHSPSGRWAFFSFCPDDGPLKHLTGSMPHCLTVNSL